LKPGRIVLKAKSSGIFWIKIPKSIKLLSLQAPSSSSDWSNLMDEVFLLRDFRAGSEGKAWLGCTRAGQLVVVKFPIIKKIETVDKKNDREKLEFESRQKIVKECLMWNKIYGDGTAKIVKLNNEDALVMPFVFCCSSNSSNRVREFNTSLQASHIVNNELLALDLKHVKELELIQQYIAEESSQCTCAGGYPEVVARSIIMKLTEKKLIHNDIAWRHIGIRPIFTTTSNNKASKFIRFEPTLIDLSSVEEYAEESTTAFSKLSSSIDIFEKNVSKVTLGVESDEREMI
jgi:hypothetical protein